MFQWNSKKIRTQKIPYNHKSKKKHKPLRRGHTKTRDVVTVKYASYPIWKPGIPIDRFKLSLVNLFTHLSKKSNNHAS